MATLKKFRYYLRETQPASIPLAPSRPTQAVYEFSLKIPLPEAAAHLGAPPDKHFQVKCDAAPLLCVEAMLLEWMAEPRVGVLMDLGRIRSRLPAILSAADARTTRRASPAAASSGSSSSVGASPAGSCCWRCSSCWAAYRRAVSFAACLVLVARCPRIVTLCRAHAATSKAYPAIVTALGARRQMETDPFASMLVQILGVKESWDLEEGFGALMQNLLSGGLEKAHAEKEGRGGTGVGGQMEHDGNEEGSWMDSGGKDDRDGEGGQWTEHLKGLFTYRAACILRWARTYGFEMVPASQCCKGSPQGKVRPMRHPLRDLPSLLVGLGAIPKPLDQGEFPLEWEEWPRGEEVTAKLPDDASARFFHLGIVEEARGTVGERGAGKKGGQGSNAGGKMGDARGKRGDKGRGRQEGRRRGRGEEARVGGVECDLDERLPQQLLTRLLPLVQRKYPIVRCTADAEFLVEFAGYMVKPPACAECKQCFALYRRNIPFLAVIANYAYRPASILFKRFVSIFPPLSPEFDQLAAHLACSCALPLGGGPQMGFPHPGNHWSHVPAQAASRKGRGRRGVGGGADVVPGGGVGMAGLHDAGGRGIALDVQGRKEVGRLVWSGGRGNDE
ncbi:unnamed protein product [Closterium sp. Yama58-4]|nr:unnamed protein product [Closterium sp. Yama58-4]